MAAVPASIQVLGQWDFPRLLLQSPLSIENIDDVESGAVHIYPGIYLTAEENHENPDIENRIKAVHQSSLQMGSRTAK